MREKVFIHPIQVSRKGEINSFQIKLPMDAKKIIGIESTVKGIERFATVAPRNVIAGFDNALMGSPFGAAPVPSGNLVFLPTPIAGELRLQSHGQSNVFYSTDVKLSDANVGFGDFSQSPFWKPQVFSHEENFFEDIVLVDDKSYVLSGTYRDRFGEERGFDFNYRINVYVWYEIENNVGN